MSGYDYIGASTVCPDGNPFLRLLVVRKDGWWIVENQATRECLTGGFETKTEATEWARGWSAERVTPPGKPEGPHADR